MPQPLPSRRRHGRPSPSSQSYPAKPIRFIVPFGAYSDLLLVVHPSLPIVKLAGAWTDQ
jgi:hypothetical protein